MHDIRQTEVAGCYVALQQLAVPAHAVAVLHSCVVANDVAIAEKWNTEGAAGARRAGRQGPAFTCTCVACPMQRAAL